MQQIILLAGLWWWYDDQNDDDNYDYDDYLFVRAGQLFLKQLILLEFKARHKRCNRNRKSKVQILGGGEFLWGLNVDTHFVILFCESVTYLLVFNSIIHKGIKSV